MDRVDFREVLMQIRRKRNMRYRTIAKYAGCAETTISDIASGRTKEPKYHVGATLLKLAA